MHKSHLVFTQNCWFAFPNSGTLRCRVLQAQRPSVMRQDQKMLQVPRTPGSGCHLAVALATPSPKILNIVYVVRL